MKKMKQLVSLLIVFAVLMAMSASIVSVSAETVEMPAVEVTDADWLRVEKLEALGTITNEYEDIGAYVSRRQMADIIATYLKVKNTGDGAGKSPFVDVAQKDASIGNIIALFNAGVITGDEGLRFHPDNYLTYNEALVFVINAVGYKSYAAREGGYPTGYHRVAIKNRMLVNLKFDSGKEYIPLCDVYKLLESGLNVGAVKSFYYGDGSADYEISSTETYLSDLYGIESFEGIITGTENTRLDSPDSNLSIDQIEIDGALYDTPGYTYTTSLGRAVIYYVRKTANGEFDIAYIEENARCNNIVKVDSEDLLVDKTTSSRIYYMDGEEKEERINLHTTVSVIYNGKCYKGYGRIANVLPDYGYIEAVDNNGDEVADVLFVYEYENVIVGSVDTYAESFAAMYTGNDYPAEDEKFDKINIRLMPDNKKLTFKALKQWDVATVMKSKGDSPMYTVYISRETVTGTVTEVSSEKGYLINDTYYKSSIDYVGETIQIGTKAKFYLDFNGKIVTCDMGDVEDTSSYATVVGMEYGTTPMTAKITLKLYAPDGTFLKVPLKENVKIDGTVYDVGNAPARVAELLSGGATNAEGKYYIETPFVISYTQTGSEISRLDTGRIKEPGKFQIIAEGDSVLARTGGIIRATLGPNGVNGAKYIYYEPGNTLTFCTPSAGALEDESKYSIMTGPSTNRYYRDESIYGARFTVPTDSYVMYNIGGSEIETVKIILFVGYTGATTVNQNTTTVDVVSKVTMAVNDENESRAKIYFGNGTSKLAAKTISVTQGATTIADVPTEEIANYFATATVAQFGINADGEIASANILVTYDEEADAPVQVYTGGGTPGESEYCLALGEVVAVDTKTQLLKVRVGSGDTASDYLVPTSGANVMIYRSDEKSVTSGNSSSFAVGDVIMVRMTNYYQTKEAIIYK